MTSAAGAPGAGIKPGGDGPVASFLPIVTGKAVPNALVSTAAASASPPVVFFYMIRILVQLTCNESEVNYRGTFLRCFRECN